jgi:hypothetical protein
MNDWRGDVPGGRYPNVYFSRSTNGGASWSTGVRVNDIEPLYQQVSSHALVKLPDGTLTAGWLNSNVSVSQFRTCVSTNEGATWSASVRADEPSPGGAGTYSSIAAFGTWVFAGYDAYDGNWNAWMRASSDGGRSWTEPAARMDDDVTGSPSGNTVIAPFSPTTIYGAWQDGRPTPAPWLIMTTRGTRQGTDVGETWATQGTGDTGRTGLVLRPNPARSGEEIHIGFARESGHAPVITPGAVVGIYDLLGRVVRILPVSAQGAVWDGRDSGGRVVAPGLYRARYDAASSGAPILVIR